MVGPEVAESVGEELFEGGGCACGVACFATVPVSAWMVM